VPVTVSVPELAGKQAHVTVSAVDVGILNITRFPVPDANAHFFAQRRLGVDAYDIYGRVIESFEGGIAKMRFGGDMALAALPQARRPTSRVQTVDLFSGPVNWMRRAMRGSRWRCRISTAPCGSRRWCTRTRNTAIAMRETLVRAPIVAEASMPRVMAPGDSARSPWTCRTSPASPASSRCGGRHRPGIRRRGQPHAAAGRRSQVHAEFPAHRARGLHHGAGARAGGWQRGFKVDRKYDLPVRAAWPSVLRSRTQVLGEGAPRRWMPASPKA
jgi:hypothetical protein